MVRQEPRDRIVQVRERDVHAGLARAFRVLRRRVRGVFVRDLDFGLVRRTGSGRRRGSRVLRVRRRGRLRLLAGEPRAVGRHRHRGAAGEVHGRRGGEWNPRGTFRIEREVFFRERLARTKKVVNDARESPFPPSRPTRRPRLLSPPPPAPSSRPAPARPALPSCRTGASPARSPRPRRSSCPGPGPRRPKTDSPPRTSS